MAVLIDIFGSCVCRDIFRHVDKTKYEVRRCLGNIPVTTLFDKRIPIKKGMMDEAKLTPYEKKMLRIQMKKNAIELLKKSDAEILMIDFADELMERWEIASEYSYDIAVPEGKENEYEKVFGDLKSGKIRQYSPFELDIEEVEQSIKMLAEELVRSDDNPVGYEEKNIILIESLYAADIMGNDGKLHMHRDINISECNDFLKTIYQIFLKYVQDCQVIRLPKFTHSSENHIRGLHPLHYMESTYDYFVKVIDVLNGYSNLNTIQNLYNEYSLKNTLETRTAKSSAIYSIEGIKKRVEKLEEKDKPIKVDIFGSCVSRDVFRFSIPGKYEVCTNIERNSVTSLYEKTLLEDIHDFKAKIASYEQRMFITQLKKNAVEQLKKSDAEILIMDLAEERLDRYEVKYKGEITTINYWKKADALFKELCRQGGGCTLHKVKKAYEINDDFIREKFSKLAKDIIQTEKNPKGYKEENIYVIEAKFAEKIVSKQGSVRKYYNDYQVEKYNFMLDRMYSILYEYFPKCKKIKMPPYTYATENHKWGRHPLHYEDKTYKYFLDVLEADLGLNQTNTATNIYKNQSLENKLYTRILNFSDMYQLKKQVADLNQEVQSLKGIINDLSGGNKNEE